MEILYMDRAVLVCLKPAGVLSTDEPGGVPGLLREALGEPQADLRTVHRLDRAVSGLMVLARSAAAASELSRQIREGGFEKEYRAVVHGLTPPEGQLQDLMFRDKARKMSFVTETPGKGVQQARLSFVTLRQNEGLSELRIRLETGRTHQIRVHMASLGHPLLGDGLYGAKCPDKGLEGQCLHARQLRLIHPRTGEELTLDSPLPDYFLDVLSRLGPEI